MQVNENKRKKLRQIRVNDWMTTPQFCKIICLSASDRYVKLKFLIGLFDSTYCICKATENLYESSKISFYSLKNGVTLESNYFICSVL